MMSKKIVLVSFLITSCGVLSPTEPREASIVQPTCENPAPLINADHRAYPDRVVDDYLILLKSGFDVRLEGPRLAQKYGFEVREFFTIIPAFGATLHARTVAALRCEPSILNVEISNTNVPPP